MLKNKKLLIGVAVALVLVLAGGGYFLFANKSQTIGEPSVSEEVVQTLEAEEIGLTLEASSDKKKVKFAIEKGEGFKTIEYELTYEANSTAQERSEGGEEKVQRGITGEEQVKGGSSYESPWLDLGSCSKNVCRYDTGVESVSLTLKIVKDDGKTYLVEDSLEL